MRFVNTTHRLPKATLVLRSLMFAAHVLLAGCAMEGAPDPELGVVREALTTPTPLIDMPASIDYFGLAGGLYPGSSNTPPTAHHEAGLAQSAAIVPRAPDGSPAAPANGGAIVLLSVGMSNTTAEYATFQATAQNDYRLNPAVRVLNGAYPSQVATTWDSPTESNYDRVRDTILAPGGYTEAQVQAVWLKVANGGPTASIAAGSASPDAYALQTHIGNIARALAVRYPNLRQVFLSSRIYGGYATTPLNPEPYAYESGFSVKWSIGAQIAQTASGTIDARSGNLSYTASPRMAPWMAWGPYLWADGTTPNSQGLSYARSDLDPTDGTHPAPGARQKVADALLSFFLQSPYTVWFRDQTAVPPPPTSIALTTSGSPNNFSWTANTGVGNPNGFVILFSKAVAVPTYPAPPGVTGFARAFSSGPPWTAWIAGNDGSGVYHVRVCAIASGSACAAYSNQLDVTLTTSSDTVAPVISGVLPSGVTASSASIGWTTHEAASSTVQYGLTAAYGSTASNTALVTTRAIALSGLSASTLYHYRVCSTDAANNQACTTDASFTTAASGGGDTTPPVISNVAASALTSTGATIGWTTDEASTTVVSYGATTSYGSTSSDPALVTAHSRALTGLSAATLHHYRVCSTDAAGNQACSADATLTTAPAPSATITLTRVGTTNQFQWTTTGDAGNPGGFRFVASKTVNPPVFPGTPPVTGYLAIAYGGGGPTWSATMSPFNGTGTYHVRVCAYQSATNACTAYSNMVDITY